MKVGESPALSEATREARIRRTSASDRLQRHRPARLGQPSRALPPKASAVVAGISSPARTNRRRDSVRIGPTSLARPRFEASLRWLRPSSTHGTPTALGRSASPPGAGPSGAASPRSRPQGDARALLPHCAGSRVRTEAPFRHPPSGGTVR